MIPKMKNRSTALENSVCVCVCVCVQAHYPGAPCN